MGLAGAELIGNRILEARDFELALAELVRSIPPGVDRVLDNFRESKAGDSSYSTSLNRQVRAFLTYRAYAETGTRFLDWGCRHAWDSCMVRMVNPQASIDGCDITEQMVETTRSFAGMQYKQLNHKWKLPYADDAFDRVICSGVLEHAPMLNNSLTELNRIIEPGGMLMVTFFPNRLSYTEFASRNIFKRGKHHRRLYSLTQLERLLVDHGFEPVKMGFHQFLPSLTTGHASLRWAWMGSPIRWMFQFDPFLERVWPINRFGANLFAIARKRDYM